MGGEADNVTEIDLGIHFNHSVAGSWVGDVNADPWLRERCPAGRQWSWSGRMKEKSLRLQVHWTIGRFTLAELLLIVF